MVIIINSILILIRTEILQKYDSKDKTILDEVSQMIRNEFNKPQFKAEEAVRVTFACSLPQPRFRKSKMQNKVSIIRNVRKKSYVRYLSVWKATMRSLNASFDLYSMFLESRNIYPKEKYNKGEDLHHP